MLKTLNLLPVSLLLTLATPALSLNNTKCEPHLYNIHIFSEDPLVIYIPNFITPAEATHLQSISEGTFSDSRIADQTGQQQLASTRTSQSTSLASDEIVACIEKRALAFQGRDLVPARLEPLQLVKYSQDQKYHAHTDWFTSESQATPEHGGNRLSSFFVYVHASEDVVGGGTQFPMVDAPKGEEWCEFVDCDAPWDDGVVFRPIPGNAVFWRNLKKTKTGHTGDRRTLHAGMPVQRGEKLGMNIWTREGIFGEQFRSA